MTTELLQDSSEASIRETIVDLIKSQKTRDDILKTLKIKNGDLIFHLRHIAHESGSSQTSIEGLLRHFRRQAKRPMKH